MVYVAGIDVGSRSVKAVVMDGDRQVLGKGIVRTRADFASVAQEALDAALEQAGLSQAQLSYIATTGLGRYNVPFRDAQITEITCAARGAAHLFPNTQCVLDIGAQSSRAVKVLPGGKVKEFRSNDKCAAGAGGFIERAARYLEVELDEVGELSARAQQPQPISSVCAVLAESEIINHVTAGATVEDILRGIHDSLATRSKSLLRRVRWEPELTWVGGVARQTGMAVALEQRLETKVNVPEEPEFVCALGAALLALRRLEKVGTPPRQASLSTIPFRLPEARNSG